MFKEERENSAAVKLMIIHKMQRPLNLLRTEHLWLHAKYTTMSKCIQVTLLERLRVTRGLLWQRDTVVRNARRL